MQPLQSRRRTDPVTEINITILYGKQKGCGHINMIRILLCRGELIEFMEISSV